MKKRWICRTLALAAAAVCALNQITAVAFSSGTNDLFYQELARMIDSRDDSCYFGVVKLTPGSDILAVDGVEVRMDAPSQLRECRTMLPLQAIAAAAGAETVFDSQTGVITLTTSYGSTLCYALGGDILSVDGVSRALDVSAYVEDGQVYIPLRATLEALEMDVEWEQETATVTITAPYQTARIVVLTEELDVSALNAEQAISDGSGMWVLQFATPAQAKEALTALTAQGIKAEPDYYVAL